jgi:hypothetical protein
MSDYTTALQALRDARDALNAVDLPRAEAALRAHDAAVREACTGNRPLATSEMEMLAAGQRELLQALLDVQSGVARELSATRKGGAAARAYLGNAGG